MNHRLDGMAHEAKGTLKETIGKATDDRSQQLSGSAERHAGKAEQMVALLADRARRNDPRR
ncbi:MAG TPA: CsbD family protein [Xanthomonadaceae bacterium]|nr:CsbD family protein [Xanthomonadaceae bacterium]